MTQSPVIRFPFRLRKADEQALARLEILDSEIVGTRIGPEAEVQVRTASGEIYNLETLPKFRARRAAHSNHDPLPPAGAMALSRVA